VFSIQDGSTIDFYVTKQNIQVARINGTVVSDTLKLSQKGLNATFSKGLAGAVSEKALCLGLKKVKWDD
jgi:ABC-type xylose transport system substrate-binding protein